MSCILIVDSVYPDEQQHTRSWDASSGVFDFVLRTIAEHVPDPELMAALRKFLDDGYRYFPLSAYGDSATAEMVRVIQGPLLPAAERYPWSWDPQAIVDHIRELVNDVNQWANEVNQQRRAEGRPELPSGIEGPRP